MSPERWLAVAESASPESVEMLAEIMGQQVAAGPRLARRCRAAGRMPSLAAGPARPELAEGQDTRLRRRSAKPVPPARSPGRAAPARDPGLAAFGAGLVARVPPRVGARIPRQPARRRPRRGDELVPRRAPAHDDVTLWQRLLESPHDDVRLALAADLEARLGWGRRTGTRPVACPWTPIGSGSSGPRCC